MGFEGGGSSFGVEGQNYGGGWWIYVSNFKFVPQTFGGAILLSMSKTAPKMASAHKIRRALLLQISAGTCSHALPCALDWLLQPVLLHSTTSSCYCTFPSNFCVAMAEQLCSNPWRNNFVEGITPPKRPNMTKIGGWGHRIVQINPHFQTHRFPMKLEPSSGNWHKLQEIVT